MMMTNARGRPQPCSAGLVLVPLVSDSLRHSHFHVIEADQEEREASKNRCDESLVGAKGIYVHDVMKL